MTHYCGQVETIGHGSNAICGVVFYTDIFQCDRCKTKDANAIITELMAALRVMLRDYAAVYDIGDVEMQPAIYQARAAIAKALGETQ